jgi:septum formation protein
LRVNEQTLLVLASNSPRRRQLLALAGWSFSLAPADVDERLLPGESASAYVVRLAEAKARVAAVGSHPGQVVIGSDTTVVDGGMVLGKPQDMAEAGAMLSQLRGHIHQVYTGLAALRMRDGRLGTDLCITDVPMRAYSDEEIDAYVASGDPLDKAGAYAIQHPDFQPVESMSGCYASVMGFPLCHLVRLLRRFEITPTADVPANCQNFLHYECPVSRSILAGEPVV